MEICASIVIARIMKLRYSVFCFFLFAATFLFAQQPVPPTDGNPDSEKAYEKAKEEWVKNHPEEYANSVKANSKPVVAGEASPREFARFLSFPTSHEHPMKFDSGNPKDDQLVYEMRVQHWTLIHDFKNYQAKYGALPKNFPGGVSAEEYSKNPPSHAYSEDLERAMAERKKSQPNQN